MIGVSCICPTYGRTNLLPEAVESFLKQDYNGERELVIVNDLGCQEIRCDAPNVRVINLKERFGSLGEKRTFSYQQASLPFIITWGDDDIHLPNRISRSVNNLGDRKMVLDGWHFCLHGSELKYNKFPTTGAHLVEAELAKKIGYFPNQSTGEDAEFNARVSKEIGSIHHIKERPAFLYRWSGTNRPHISAFHGKNSHQIMGDKIAELLKNGTEPTGVVEIKPFWAKDYVALANQHI